LTNISYQLRSKSTRKEAIWRQHTLTAAYTTKDAKDRINSAACAVVDEICNAIKHFTTQNEEEPIRYAVRRIVKLAAEAWRFARLEREMIEAKLPATEDVDEDDEKAELWVPQRFNSAAYPVNAIKPVFEGPDEGRKILLRILPIIRREAVHQNFRLTPDEVNDDGCVYSQGLALYSDAPAVLARRQEMRRATNGECPDLETAVASTPLPLKCRSTTSLEGVQDSIMLIKKPSTPLSSCLAPLSFRHSPELLKQPPEPSKPTSTRSSSLALDVAPDLKPQRSHADTPPSPLYPAVNEIESLNNRSRYPQTPFMDRHDTSRSESKDSNDSSWEDESVQASAPGQRARNNGRLAGVKSMYDGSNEVRFVGRMGNARGGRGTRGERNRYAGMGRGYMPDWNLEKADCGRDGRDNR
jgi:hypothetical protein